MLQFPFNGSSFFNDIYRTSRGDFDGTCFNELELVNISICV